MAAKAAVGYETYEEKFSTLTLGAIVTGSTLVFGLERNKRIMPQA